MSEALAAAIADVLELVRTRPEKNMLVLQDDIMAGRRPRGCPVHLGRVQHWTEVPAAPDEVPDGFLSPEETLLPAVQGIPKALDMANPFTPAVGTGWGVPTVATAFGIEIDFSPRNPGGVKGHLPLEAFDDFQTPDIRTAGVFPRLREQIEYYKNHLPPEIKISIPDLQGPINTAHLILGTEVFVAMHTEKARLHHLLQMITDVMIQCFTLLPQWIGPERHITFPGSSKRICECSVNLISRDSYREFGLPYDRQIAEALGEVGIHPCGGLHVFEETLAGLPNVVYSEWADVRCSFAREVGLDAALEAIGDRPIILSGGRELWEGSFEARIKDDLAHLEDHPRLTFGYSGMKWREEDKPHIAALRRQMDEYYEDRFS